VVLIDTKFEPLLSENDKDEHKNSYGQNQKFIHTNFWFCPYEFLAVYQ